MKARRWAWGVVAAVALLAARPAQSVPGAGEKTPEFALRDLYKATRVVRSAQALPGKTTLLSFFATWCKPCIAEMPKFRALAVRYRDRGFRVVLISVDQIEEKELLKFMKKVDVSGMEVLWDEETDAMSEYGVFNLPTNILVGPKGTVLLSWQGDQPGRIAEVESRLKKLPVPP